MQKLNNYDEDYTYDDFVEEQHFQVDDDNKAEWLLNKLKEKKRDYEKFKTFYETRLQYELKKFEQFENYANLQLENYLLKDLEAVKITKTERKYNLPSGEIKLKKQPLKYEFNDVELLQELKDKNIKEFIKNKEIIDWANLKKNTETNRHGEVFITETGEIINSVKAEQQDNKFTIKLFN